MSFKFLPHIALQLNSRDQAIDFYRRIFGMDIVADDGREAQLKLGDAHFYIEEDPRGMMFLSFEVDDLGQARQTLLASGAQIYDETSDGFMVCDPFGLRFYLSRASS